MTDNNQATNETNEDKDYYYASFNPNNVDSGDPKERSFNNGQIKYNDVPLQYNYGTSEFPVIDQFMIELPQVTCRGGISKKVEDPKPGKDGKPYIKTSYSMMLLFDLQEEENRKCLDVLDQLHSACSHALGKQKAKVGLFDFDPERPGSAFKNPVYYKRDQVTGQRVKGSNPSLWVKMNHYKTNKTLFTDLNGEPIDWDLLYDVELKLYPLLHVSHIYVGTKNTLQIKLISAVITDIAELNTRTRQTRTLDRLRQQRGLVDSVSSQLAQIRMNRQDHLDSGGIKPQMAHLPSDDGSMHQIPNDNSDYQGSQDSLNDYLNGAPAMTNVQSQPPVQAQTPVQYQQPSQQIPAQNTQYTEQVQLNTNPPQIPQNLVPNNNQVNFNPGMTQGTTLQIQ